MLQNKNKISFQRRFYTCNRAQPENIIGAKDFLHNNQTIIHTYACPRPTNLLFNLKTTFSSFDFFFSLPFFFGRPPLIFQMVSFVEEEGGRDKKIFWKKNHSHYRLSVFKQQYIIIGEVAQQSPFVGIKANRRFGLYNTLITYAEKA